MYNTPEQQREAQKRWDFFKGTEIVDGKIFGSEQPHYYRFYEWFDVNGAIDGFWRRFAAGLAYSDESAEEWCKQFHTDKYHSKRGVLMKRGA